MDQKEQRKQRRKSRLRICLGKFGRMILGTHFRLYGTYILICALLARLFHLCSASKVSWLCKQLHLIAERFEFGENVNKDIQTAQTFYGIAAMLGHLSESRFKYATTLMTETQHRRLALSIFLERGEEGDARALSNAGVLLDKQNRPEEAFQCYLKSANSGNLIAKYNVACCYLRGTGTERSRKEAQKWFQETKEQIARTSPKHLLLEGFGMSDVEDRLAELSVDDR